jgi:hypothetical protein
MVKKLIVISLIFIVLASGGFYLIHKSNNINPLNKVIQIEYTNNFTTDGSLSEETALFVQKAFENYLYEDKNESKTDRNARLSQFFSGDSHVYEDSYNFINAKVTKSTSKISSIRSYESESDDFIYEASISVQLEGIENTVSKTYILSTTRLDDSSFVARAIWEKTL